MANTFSAAANQELLFDKPLRNGDRGARVKRVQEWLTFHRFATSIDNGFGAATEQCVRLYQTAKKLKVTGIVDQATWDSLVAPLTRALTPVTLAPGDTLSKVILKIAKQHFAELPVEIGPDNCGPWVRVYMDGNEGTTWKWCAGFVTFIMKQACTQLQRPTPIAGSFSCDSLAYQARAANLFIPGKDVGTAKMPWAGLKAVQIFLERRTATDWVHTGFAFAGQGQIFSTLEGNTNDGGSSNGYAVMQRTRSVTNKDFIVFPD